MKKQTAGLREVNLEIGRPFVEEAIKRMTQELQRSRTQGFGAVKLIHGYGSSGKGGKIRTAVRKQLRELQEEGTIRTMIPGEGFTIFEETTRQAFLRCPSLREDRDLEHCNNGVTIVIL